MKPSILAQRSYFCKDKSPLTCQEDYPGEQVQKVRHPHKRSVACRGTTCVTHACHCKQSSVTLKTFKTEDGQKRECPGLVRASK